MADRLIEATDSHSEPVAPNGDVKLPRSVILLRRDKLSDRSEFTA